MKKVKAGDLDKMGLLYERHKKRLFGFFYNMNSNASLSEDLVQNVFIRMIKYKHTFTGEGSFLAWMFTTARNVNHDHFNKRKKAYNERELSAVEYKLQAHSDTEKVIENHEDRQLLRLALNRLDAEKKEVLVLSKLKEIKFSEIGEIMGCSEGAAKVKAHRALKELRSIFLQLQTR
ncbi:RNA polymerase sigma factor [Allomuricauda sp. d1]|uniref:RNA polymerase sigma factor n=1 Tax=Allomuricauda sp. d1 TaxID=3136725 RepID=UPI0031E09505